MTVPKPASVADHEASHAVVWRWWWASQPECHNPGTGREIWCVTIESEDPNKEGEFVPGPFPLPGNQTPDDRLCLEHQCATALAGPISDKLRKEKRKLDPSDERKIKTLTSGFWPSSPEKADRFIEELRPKVELFLERPEVRAMVKGLKKALLERKTLDHDDAVAAMEAAQPS